MARVCGHVNPSYHTRPRASGLACVRDENCKERTQFFYSARRAWGVEMGGEVVFASHSIVFLIGRSPVIIPYNCAVCEFMHLAPGNVRRCYESLLLDGARQHFETLQSFVPGLIIVRVAPTCRPLGTFRRQLRRRYDI